MTESTIERPLESVDPTSGEHIRAWPELSAAELERRLEQSRRTAIEWARVDVGERAPRCRRAAQLLRERVEPLALLMAEEMGKPVAQGRAEIEKCAATFEHFAGFAPGALADETVSERERVVFRPLGPVLAIEPWNFPFWQLVRFAAPALMAGNVVLLKHSENVQGCAQAIEKLFADAGFPEGALLNLAVGVKRVPDLIGDPRVRAVTLTGSTRAGRSVGALAGAALKKCVLELGGSDPYVVLADADLELAAKTCVASRLINAGQSCIAAKRFIVVESVRAELTERMVARLRAVTVGDPRGAVDVGPLARGDLAVALERQVAASVERGARLVHRGAKPARGSFFAPVVLDGVRPGMPAFDEETFGPAAAIVAAKDEDEAFALANATAYGLGAALFTRDVERGLALARERLDAGNVFLNDFVRSDPRLPFGGIKDSGFGRELSAFGLREFVNVKTVVGG